MGNCLPLFSGDGEDEEDDTAPLHHRQSSVALPPPSATHSPQSPPSYSLDHQRAVSSAATTEQRATDEEQLVMARRRGLLRELPTDTFVEGGKGDQECAICMVDLVEGDAIRFLPCLHVYHRDCVDSWLLRSFTCPSCMEPVDSALLSSYAAHTVGDLAALSCSPANAGPLPSRRLSPPPPPPPQ